MEFLTTLFMWTGILVWFVGIVMFLGWLLSFITPQTGPCRGGPR